MRRALKIGFSFGLPSGIVTTLGLMVGLYSTTQSKYIVMGGILTIAVADSLSDAMGMHLAQESDNNTTHLDVWKSTIFTLIGKFIFSSIFIIPVLLLNLQTAIFLSIAIGLYLIFLISFIIARMRNDNPYKVICEHVFITIIVIIIAHYIGVLISNVFGCM
jgi:VIT1/CCC1 family predicted Fe2+/Mn2+ transporter